MGNSATDALAGSPHIGETRQGERNGGGVHPALIVEEIRGWQAFLRLRQPWQAATISDADAVLLGHDWTAQAWKSLRLQLRRRPPLVLGARDVDGAWHGFAALRWRRPRWLEFLAAERSQRLDAAGANSVLWIALGRHLRRRRDWDALDLAFLRPASAERVATSWPRLGLAVHSRGDVRQHCINLNRPWLEIESGFSPYLRANFTRRFNRLRKLGDLRLLLHTSDPLPCLRECFALEAAGWKGRSGTAMARLPDLQRFYRQLACRLAASGQLRLYGLVLNNRVVAFELCLCSLNSARMYPLKIAYAEDLRTASPGVVLRWLLLQDACKHFREYEFLGDDAHWKADWSTGVTVLRHLRIYNRTLRGQTLLWRSRLYRRLRPHWNHPPTPG